jgi:hypothetical protein
MRDRTLHNASSIPFFLFLVALHWIPQVSIAQSRLPNVTQEMECADFWIKKIRDPERLILTADEIRGMNERNLNNQGLYLFNVKEQKQSLTRDEMLALFKEDWEGFARPEGTRYGRNGKPLTLSFWNDIDQKLNKEWVGENHPLHFGLVVKRTDIRVFPTHDACKVVPDEEGFDVFQHSTISPGSLVGVYHSTNDGLWTYVQTQFVRGWIRTRDLAIARDKREALDYDGCDQRLVATGSFIKIFADPAGRELAFTAQMGSSFPWGASPNQIEAPRLQGAAPSPLARDKYYVVKIPTRETDGRLTFRMGYVSKSEDVHAGFLPFNQQNVARQAFKMLHEPYGWGETDGGRDCSRFIMDLFASFGIVMPRNSKYQAMIGEDLGVREEMRTGEKLCILDQTTPLTTLLRLPGHIMLYLGKHQGRYYVIHSLWSIQKADPTGLVLSKIGRVVVSDLSLGESAPNGALLDRISDARSISGRARLP